MALEVRVQRGRCIATKACVNAAPDTFSIDATNVATATEPPGDDEASLIEAAEACPTGAISVWQDGKQLA